MIPLPLERPHSYQQKAVDQRLEAAPIPFPHARTNLSTPTSLGLYQDTLQAHGTQPKTPAPRAGSRPEPVASETLLPKEMSTAPLPLEHRPRPTVVRGPFLPT